MPPKKPSHLTEAELRIMNIVWKKEKATVADVAASLPAEQNLAYNTVLATMRILENKGYLKHAKAKDGRPFIYQPVVGRTEATRNAVRHLLHSYAVALIRIAELRIDERNTASGIFSSPSRLRDRVEMLVRHGRVFSTAAARRAITLAVLALAALATGAAFAPRWIAFAQRPVFEVASVKENTTNSYPDFRPRRSGELFMMHNTRIFALVNYAYDITAGYQVDGYERFPESDKWYDIDARTPNGANDEQVKLMVQSLLEDRFKFKTHRENREITQYALVVDRGEAKLSPAIDRPMDLTIEGRRILQPEGTCGVSLWREGARWTCKAVSIDKIVATAGQMMRAPVVDRTGLKGSYDVNVRFITDDRRLDPDAPFGPTFEQALREELGLRLEKSKGEIQVLVIDHMEKPSEN